MEEKEEYYPLPSPRLCRP